MSSQSHALTNQTDYTPLLLPANSASTTFDFTSGLPVGPSVLTINLNGVVSVLSDLTYTLYKLNADGTVASQHEGTLVSLGNSQYSFSVDPSYFSVTTILAVRSASLVSLGGGLQSASLDYLSAGITAMLSPASDTGASNSDGITSVAQPVFTGTAEAGATIVLRDGATIIGTTTADGSTGAWSVISATLGDGGHLVTATETDTTGQSSATSGTIAVTIDTTAPAAPSSLALSPSSDTGAAGDGLTSSTTPVLTGQTEAGAIVTVRDGTTVIGTTVADGSGGFSVPSGPLSDGVHAITATATDAAGNTGPAAAIGLTIDTIAPPVTLALANDTGASATDGVTTDPTLTGNGDPNAVVTLTENGTVLGSTMADAAGHWTYRPVQSIGSHTVTATETDAAGNTGSASVSYSLQPARFDITDVTQHVSTTDPGQAYSGPVAGLDYQYLNLSPHNLAVSALVADAFIHTGAGDDAISAQGGRNVLDGGNGSNFLLGAMGAGDGEDSFFLDGRGGQVTWDTIVNLHAGDAITLFGFTSNSTMQWTSDEGADGFKGATLHSELGGAGTGINASLTLAGFSLADAQSKLQTSTGSVGGSEYLYIKYG